MRSQVLAFTAAVCVLLALIFAGFAAKIGASMPQFDAGGRALAAQATAVPVGLGWLFAAGALGSAIAAVALRAKR